MEIGLPGDFKNTVMSVVRLWIGKRVKLCGVKIVNFGMTITAVILTRNTVGTNTKHPVQTIIAVTEKGRAAEHEICTYKHPPEVV